MSKRTWLNASGLEVCDRELTAREERLVDLLAEGMTNRDISQATGYTEHMVKNYLRNVYDKLGMHNRVELALWRLAHRKEKTECTNSSQS